MRPALFGTIGALIAPRKGLLARDGFIVAGVIGIVGVAHLALKEEVLPYAAIRGMDQRSVLAA